MRREPFRASAILGLVAGLALPAIAGNRTQQPAAKPEPAHPAVRPANTHPADAAAAKPAAARPVEAAAPAQPAAAPASGIVQPVAASAKPAPREAQGGDAKPPPTPPDKVQKERQEKEREAAEAKEKEKERIEKAREQEKAKTATPAKPGEAARPAAAGPGSAAEQRVVAKKAAHFEQNYRNRQARIDRLIRIYKGKGDTAKVAHLEQLKAQQEKRRANAMEGFRKQLSSDNWGKLNSEMRKDDRVIDRKPAPATPGTRPATPPKSGG